MLCLNGPSRVSRVMKPLTTSDRVHCFASFSSPIKINQHRFLLFAWLQHHIRLPKIPMNHPISVQAVEDILQSFQQFPSAGFWDPLRADIFTIVEQCHPPIPQEFHDDHTRTVFYTGSSV